MKSVFILAGASAALSLAFVSSVAGAGPVFTIDAQAGVQPISRLIYGVNDPTGYSNVPYTRLGGNRWTAYNWTNNASNAGSDYQYQNDDYLGGGSTPGGALIPTLNANAANNATTLITIPINGYVAADTLGGGDVRNSGPNYLQTRFRQEAPAKGSAFTLTPDPANPVVYQDEFANWVKTLYPASQTNPNQAIYFSLDNEPDLWQSTHAEVHPGPVTYAELVQKTIAYATALKAVAPNSLIFGPANYGWYGYTTLQGAPDANGRDFQSYYLQQMKLASDAAGTRLLDVLDVHWYPEATGDGVRITGTDTTAAVVAARLQAPRSLWDPTYTETSWITQDSTNGPIDLLPLLKAKIAANDPGTKLSISEYNYGGGQDISGGIAEADVLGIFGKQGVFAANEWHLNTDESFIQAAFGMYRNFDGQNSTFGDTSISASTSDVAATSIYASVDSANPNHMVLVAINKTGAPLTTKLSIANMGQIYRTAKVYTLAGGSSTIQFAGTLTMSDPNNFFYTMPADSVTTLSFLAPGMFGDANLDGKITIDDFLAVDRGYIFHLTGWANGDFNGDGTIDGTDYALLDQAYKLQNSSASGVLAPAAVPEPASLLLLGLPVAAVTGRRRRRGITGVNGVNTWRSIGA
jgi:hypothetical protein